MLLASLRLYRNSLSPKGSLGRPIKTPQAPHSVQAAKGLRSAIFRIPPPFLTTSSSVAPQVSGEHHGAASMCSSFQETKCTSDYLAGLSSPKGCPLSAATAERPRCVAELGEARNRRSYSMLCGNSRHQGPRSQQGLPQTLQIPLPLAWDTRYWC